MYNKNIKFVFSYSDFIKVNEQEMGMGGMGVDPMAGAGGNAPPPKKDKIFSFIFINHPTNHEVKNYEDGGYTKRYITYEMPEKDISKWIDVSLKAKRDGYENVSKEDILNAITGEKFSLTKSEKKFLDFFRHSVTVGKKGERSIDIDVYFDKNHIPSTDSLEVTFLDTISK